MTGFTTKVADTALPEAMDLLADLVCAPPFRTGRPRAGTDGHSRRNENGRGHAR
jgi:hypothetical protein